MCLDFGCEVGIENLEFLHARIWEQWNAKRGRWFMEIGKGEASHGHSSVGYEVANLFGLEL